MAAYLIHSTGKIYFWIFLHKSHFKVPCGLFQVRPPSAVLLKKVPSTWLYSARWWQWWSALPKVNDIYFGLPLSFSIPLPHSQMLFIDAFSLNAQPSVIPSLPPLIQKRLPPSVLYVSQSHFSLARWDSIDEQALNFFSSLLILQCSFRPAACPQREQQLRTDFSTQCFLRPAF